MFSLFFLKELHFVSMPSGICYLLVFEREYSVII